jgi:hypothetical protein
MVTYQTAFSYSLNSSDEQADREIGVLLEATPVTLALFYY